MQNLTDRKHPKRTYDKQPVPQPMKVPEKPALPKDKRDK